MTYIKRRNTIRCTAAGAINPSYDVIELAGEGAIAMTISAPNSYQEGTILHIVATTAQAHTVTFPTVGFNGAGAAGDVATFGGAKGDSMQIVALDGVWYTLSLRNVTLA